ncbi:O-methyltransferase [Sphingomonas canadensis]|uniref:O-methyltransferase n=1 Tax=Sphingomonas canadensis TaxID=1219257 RepID=A0ABW3H6E5_9SPHN|nr:O-methyltransferase [Sphingomonas canadensis]MCW3836800.1 O-methyltransferase [Sphingomonas canadensis]
MSDPAPAAVDAFIEQHLVVQDDGLAAALAANAAAGLPPMDVSPAQGKMIHLFARMAGARRILEIGTLGGYSTIWLARALPEGGRLVTLELDPGYAAVAQANLAAAGVVERCDVRTGPAMETLTAMIAAGEAPFDLVFVDADKPSNVPYLHAALALSRPGTVLVFDNVVREGRVLEADSADPRVQGTRALFAALAAEPRISATAIQTVGCKEWDGFLLGVVN